MPHVSKDCKHCDVFKIVRRGSPIAIKVHWLGNLTGRECTLSWPELHWLWCSGFEPILALYTDRGEVRIDQSELCSCLPPKSFVMVHYKTSHLKVLEFSRKKRPQPAKLLFWFPHYRAKKKVVVNFIYGYLTLSGEKCKSNGKRISSIRHTSEEKNPKNHPKVPLSWNII